MRLLGERLQHCRVLEIEHRRGDSGQEGSLQVEHPFKCGDAVALAGNVAEDRLLPVLYLLLSDHFVAVQQGGHRDDTSRQVEEEEVAVVGENGRADAPVGHLGHEGVRLVEGYRLADTQEAKQVGDHP